MKNRFDERIVRANQGDCLSKKGMRYFRRFLRGEAKMKKKGG